MGCIYGSDRGVRQTWEWVVHKVQIEVYGGHVNGYT